MYELDVFLQGETVDLCIPTEDFSKNSNWYSWFNDFEITRYLEQGIYPNTKLMQQEFFRSVSNETRLTLIISNKTDYIGVISLSSIDRVKRKCEIAIVLNSKLDRRNSSFIALESMAILTTHAFDSLGVERIEAGQHINLKGWQQRLELIGYRLEGIHHNKFIKGRETSDAMSIACSIRDYENIIANRGKLWDDVRNMKNRIKNLPREAFSTKLQQFFEDSSEYYDKIFFS